MADDGGAEAGGAVARHEPDDRAGRQHLFPRENRRHRRQELPADGRLDDGHERGRVPRHDDRGRPRPEVGAEMTAKITASVYTSHVPAIGAAMDLGKANEPYWQKVFAGYEFSREWIRQNEPDVVF